MTALRLGTKAWIFHGCTCSGWPVIPAWPIQNLVPASSYIFNGLTIQVVDKPALMSSIPGR